MLLLSVTDKPNQPTMRNTGRLEIRLPRAGGQRHVREALPRWAASEPSHQLKESLSEAGLGKKKVLEIVQGKLIRMR